MFKVLAVTLTPEPASAATGVVKADAFVREPRL